MYDAGGDHGAQEREILQGLSLSPSSSSLAGEPVQARDLPEGLHNGAQEA